MTLREKIIYHQAHPLKIIVDIGSALIALGLFWVHNEPPAWLIAIISPIVISVLLIAFTNLEHYKTTELGKYISRYMPIKLHLFRLISFLLLQVGAWYHNPWFLFLGILLFCTSWLGGILFPVSPFNE